MSGATVDYAAMVAHIERVKAAWREVERQKTWEEKVAAIERMRERDRVIRQARDSQITAPLTPKPDVTRPA